MSRLLSPLPPPWTRPGLADFFLLFAGFGLSLYLLRLHPLHAEANASLTPSAARQVVAFLPDLMRLPEGVVLLWPLFLGLQRVSGRPRTQALTSGEWLWVLDWAGTAFLAAVAGLRVLGWVPAGVEAYSGLPQRFWYLVLVPSMAALAVLLVLFGFLNRRQAPWTHTLGLVLVLWPAPPLAALLTLGDFSR